MVQLTSLVLMASAAGVAAFAPSTPLQTGVVNQAQTEMIFAKFNRQQAAKRSGAPAPAPAPKAAPVKKTAAPKKAPAKKAAPAPAPVAVSSVGNAFSAGLVGSSVEAPEFDPLKLSYDRSEETLAWYRAAELKHGRICMLACLGIWTQAAFTLPDPTFSLGGNAIDALYKVADERPQAIAQILLAIAAVEVLSLDVQEGREAGDLNWDPLNFQKKYKLDDPEKFAAMRLKELKNGRLAMLGASAMLVQNSLSGQGVWEQLNR